MQINILCIGDVVGKAGRSVIAEALPQLIEDHDIEFVVCNAENAAGGSGITPAIAKKLFHHGVDVITLGDHCFRKGDILATLAESDRIIRPANLPKSAAGRGMTVVDSKRNGIAIGVLAVSGQLNMSNSNSPWDQVDTAMATMDERAKVRVIDFHAEATSEKIAMGWHCNGRASVVFGTHTHVPTADAGVLDKGTAFITDVGMTGPYDSILGRRKDRVLKFLTSGMPQRFDMAIGDPRMYALKATVDTLTGQAYRAELLMAKGTPPAGGAYDQDDGVGQRFRKPKR